MSRTSPTAPSSMSSIVRLLPTISSCIGMTTAPQPRPSVWGNSRASRVGDRVHLGLRLRQFDTSLQTRDAIPIVIPTGGALLVGECERDPDVARHPGP